MSDDVDPLQKQMLYRTIIQSLQKGLVDPDHLQKLFFCPSKKDRMIQIICKNYFLSLQKDQITCKKYILSLQKGQMICKMKIALVDQPLCKTTAPLDDSDHLQKKYRRWEENMLCIDSSL